MTHKETGHVPGRAVCPSVLSRALLSAVLLGLGLTAQAQQVDMDEIAARQELRFGVTSYHAGNLNESIVSLNRSLAYDSSQTLARFWLGRAYYASGFVDSAITEWESLVAEGAHTAVLDNWIERIRLSRSLAPERLGPELTPGRLVTMAEVPGIQGGTTVFRRPAMIRPRSDGFFYLASFATHEIVLMDPNGVRSGTIDGGLEGFDRPFDVLLSDDGGLFVTEFGADRIAVVSAQGLKTGSFGSTGSGDGELLGPQYLATDGRGYLYVSDYGNRRIEKFTTDGAFVLDFGGPVGSFRGLRDPTGIAYDSGRIYVSDSGRGEVVVFDESGNYVGSLVTGLVERPESVSVYRPGVLLLADGNRLYALTVETERLDLLAELASRYALIGAVVDANRNVLVSDFQSDSLLFLAPSEELYTGLTVEIDHVIAADHPQVLAAVHVSDRNGNPVVGLSAGNFRITEDRFPTGPPAIARAGYQTPRVAVAVVADRTASMAAAREDMAAAATALTDAIEPLGSRWLVSAGELPVLEATPDDGALVFSNAAAGTAEQYGTPSIDLAIRLAGHQVLRQLDRRAVILVTDGTVGPTAFDDYGLVETADYLRNNHITFDVIYTRPNRTAAELDYLASATGGETIYLYQPAGVGPMIRRLASRPSGTYLLSYASVHDTDFGRRYIPLEVEVYLLRRSGRDESGFYGPLEF